ncbi:pentatricopeptide repeat-containing protein At5g65560-like [Magnolia sinica]|uniref:pentatricopeptide repeat-containing protein At5g65560-like n=1 Tax=Magnolia sinica TaxID=86752 RepID=UPI0026583BDC|nr:pentatricopeptide repeat-containing protein At5g65560-like [Magnolia sinica]
MLLLQKRPQKPFHGFLVSCFLSSPFSSNPNLQSPQPLPQNPRFNDPDPISDSETPPITIRSISSLLIDTSQRSRNLDALLHDFKPHLNSTLVLKILMNYKHLGRSATLDFFSWAASELSFDLDDSVIEYVADFLGRRKLFDDLRCLLWAVLSAKGRVSCRTVSICIRFLGRHGRTREALSLFKTIEFEFNCVPDNMVFNNMLYVLCKKESPGDLIDIAFAIFKRIEHPDVFSYSNILVGLCRCGKLERAISVFSEMGKNGLVPTRTAINHLVGELCTLSMKEERIEKVRVRDCRRPFDILVPNIGARDSLRPALEVFLAGCDMGIFPSAFVVSRLVSELCRLRNMEEAVEVLKVVGDRKMSCVEDCYVLVIQVLCKARRIKEACDLYERMVSCGLNPKLEIYRSIICTLCKMGNVSEAEKYFEIMNRKRCTPDSVMFTVLIHAYCGIQNWEAAYGLLMEMLGLGWCPHHHTHSLVDSLLKQQGRDDLMLKLEGKLETQMLHKYCKMGKLQEAYNKLNLMLERGFYPPIYTREVFERAFERSSKKKMARELLEKMDKVVIGSNPQT